MDAILGRDDKMVEKIADAAKKIHTEFVAIIGTPVPSVIGTDYQALCRMTEKKTGLKAVYSETTGMALYDQGESMAYLSLVQNLMRDGKLENSEEQKKQADCFADTESKKEGVLGVTPLDFGAGSGMKALQEFLASDRPRFFYGASDSLKQSVQVKKNLVLAPAGIAAAREMEKQWGIPFEADTKETDVFLEKWLENQEPELFKLVESEALRDKKILIVHQQFMANYLRRKIQKIQPKEVQVATWFMQLAEYKEEKDVLLLEEDEWTELVKEGDFDYIFADFSMKKGLPFYENAYYDFTHYAVSGQLGEKRC